MRTVTRVGVAEVARTKVTIGSRPGCVTKGRTAAPGPPG